MKHGEHALEKKKKAFQFGEHISSTEHRAEIDTETYFKYFLDIKITTVYIYKAPNTI